MTDRAGRNDPLRSFDVESVTREDGRYLLYYSWPDQAPPEPAHQGQPSLSSAHEPWTPEAGPAEDV